MQRLPVGKFLGFTGITWGIILMTTPACTNFAGIAANRFMLGLVEAAVNPGFVLVMSMWYTSQEQPLRLEIPYTNSFIATSTDKVLLRVLYCVHTLCVSFVRV